MPSRSSGNLVKVAPLLTQDQVERVKEIHVERGRRQPGIAVNDVYREVVEAGLAAINHAPETTKPTTTKQEVVP